VATLTLGLAGLPVEPAAQQPPADPFVGTWVLNLAKSKYTPGPAPKSASIAITMQGRTVTVMTDAVSATGVASHWMYAASVDGKDYPASGNPDVDTIALKQVDARTVEAVQKKAGKPTLTVRRTVSADGRTMTVTSSGKNAAGVAITNVAVYERK
jgi:hypothetical protein